MEKKNYLRVTAEVHDEEFSDMDRTIVWEVPSSYVNGDMMLDMLRTLMVGLTFTEETFKKVLTDYVLENHLLDKNDTDE